MKIRDFGNVTFDVNTEADIDALMAQRYQGGVNEFYLYDPEIEYPALSINVKGDLAALYYYPGGGRAGFTSWGNGVGLEHGGSTTFPMIQWTETVDFLDEAIVPVSTALRAAKDFLASRTLPKSLEWYEL